MDRHDGVRAEAERVEPGGIAALGMPARIVVALAVAIVAVAVAVHLAMVFLHVAPSNTLSKRHGDRVGSYIYPEFEQNWKLFAPNPLQQNIAVQARAEIRTPEGRLETSAWTDLSAQDGRGILHNPIPSHTQQNELRRAWEFFGGSHDAEDRPNGLRGQLSEQYIRRIVVLRFGSERDGGTVTRVQLRSVTTPVAAPPFSMENINTKPTRHVLPWWSVTSADLPLKARGDGPGQRAGEKIQ